MKNKNSESIHQSGTHNKLPLLGIMLGLFFPVVAILAELPGRGVPLDFFQIKQLYGSSPTQWIVLSAPFILGLIFYLIERKVIQSRSNFHLQTLRNDKQWTLLNDFISGLDKGDLKTEVPAEFENQKIAVLLENYKRKLIIDKQDEEIRMWESTGLAQFGELLRAADNLNELCDHVIKFAVKYTGSNQGSIYILRDEDDQGPSLELRACYAYDRKKFVTSTVEPGEGLVGQCYLEKETIRLLQVPENYIRITSGLGEAAPRSVVLVPLKSNEQVRGILEVASFEPHAENTIQFLEKIAGAFGSTVQTLHTNENVRKLLESSQQQTEELRSQEEEMRQNLEEMQTMQEQLARQLNENTKVKDQLEAREKVLGLTTILSEADLFGTITYVNSKFCEVTQYDRKELIGKGHNFVRHPDMPKELFKIMWSTIKSGTAFRGVVKNRKKDGSHYWVDAMIVPILEAGKVVKYVGARYHIEDDELAEKMYSSQLYKLGLAPIRQNNGLTPAFQEN